jgi:hypothetical protein
MPKGERERREGERKGKKWRGTTVLGKENK